MCTLEKYFVGKLSYMKVFNVSYISYMKHFLHILNVIYRKIMKFFKLEVSSQHLVTNGILFYF